MPHRSFGCIGGVLYIIFSFLRTVKRGGPKPAATMLFASSSERRHKPYFHSLFGWNSVHLLHECLRCGHVLTVDTTDCMVIFPGELIQEALDFHFAFEVTKILM
jgi:hypothetical protein